MHEVDRHEFNRTEATVDPTNELVDSRPQVLILFHILTRRNRELNEDDFADPFRVLGKENFERVQLLRYTLDVIESVDTNDDFAAFEPFAKRRNAGDDRFALETLCKVSVL